MASTVALTNRLRSIIDRLESVEDHSEMINEIVGDLAKIEKELQGKIILSPTEPSDADFWLQEI